MLCFLLIERKGKLSLDIFYTVAMTLNATCAVAIMLSGIQKHERHFLALALLNVLMFFFHYFSWQLHAATELNVAISMSRYQTMLAIIALPIMTLVFGSWCKFKYTNQLALIFAITSIPFLILNFIGSSSLRYSGAVELVHITTFLGDEISLLQGIANPIFIGVHLLYITNSIMLAFFSYRFFHQRESFISITVILLLIGQAIVSIVGHKIDKLELAFFYIGGLPLTLLSLICLLFISSLYKSTNEKLKIGQKKNAAIDNAINTLAQETSDAEDLNFYHKTALNIQRLFNTKYVFICVYSDDESGRRVQTLSVLDNHKVIENFSYPLKGTPCNEVINNGKCTFNNHVDDHFPEDIWLKENNIKAYIGLPLLNKDQKPLGLITLLHDEKYVIDANLSPLLDVFGGRIGAELARDKLARKLQRLAYFDYITKLPNRASLFEQINSSFKRNITHESNSLLILIDLDNFKEINKVYGYDIADDILKEVGYRLKIYAGDNLFVARNDGDEFAILIDQLKGDKTSLIEVHWQAISAIIKAPITLNEQEIIVTCSAGNVIYPLQTDDNYSVIRYAESALQQAKHNGRNQYAVFDKNVQALFERQQILLKAIQEAIQENNQLSMVYQPQTDNKGNLVGAESLIRWIHPDYGSISPAEFIPLIEQTELMHELGYWIIINVFKQIQTWRLTDFNIPEHISINIAAKQLVHHNFVDKLVSLCQEHEIAPAQIVLELTESGILHDKNTAIESLTLLKQHGFIIALDDFGTGYSSLAYLKDLPIDILKIDKSFVDDVFSPSTKQLIQSMFSISKHLKLNIIAEGMESIEQVEELTALGCTCFQGYYFSKPIKPYELTVWRYDSTKNL